VFLYLKDHTVSQSRRLQSEFNKFWNTSYRNMLQ
jgi:hypothetical protein